MFKSIYPQVSKYQQKLRDAINSTVLIFVLVNFTLGDVWV